MDEAVRPEDLGSLDDQALVALYDRLMAHRRPPEADRLARAVAEEILRRELDV